GTHASTGIVPFHVSSPRAPPGATLFPYTTLFRSQAVETPVNQVVRTGKLSGLANHALLVARDGGRRPIDDSASPMRDAEGRFIRSEEHTSELQSRGHLVCRLLLEKKKTPETHKKP